MKTLYCEYCGGTNCQKIAWVDVNTNEYMYGNKYDDIWCDDCKSTTNVATLSELWEDFSNIPINNDDEIEEEFLGFAKGASKFDVWHWFDERCPNNLHDDLMVKNMRLRKYPKYAILVTPFKHKRVIMAEDDEQERLLDLNAAVLSATLTWCSSDKLHIDDYVTGNQIDACDANSDLDAFFWEEDGSTFKELLYLPKHWYDAIENGELQVITKDEEAEFKSFLNDYKSILTDEKYEHYWDGERPFLRTELSYGTNGKLQECLPFRIYETKNK